MGIATRLGGHRQAMGRRLRVVEAMALLTIGGALQRWWPMRQWSRALGIQQAVPPTWLSKPVTRLPTRAVDRTERVVALAVRRGSHWLPWEPSCLAQAFAGQVMLRRRGTSGAVVIGLRRPENPTVSTWDAHAWLLGSDGALTGGPVAHGFTATTVYALEPAWRPPVGLDA